MNIFKNKDGTSKCISKTIRHIFNKIRTKFCYIIYCSIYSAYSLWHSEKFQTLFLLCVKYWTRTVRVYYCLFQSILCWNFGTLLSWSPKSNNFLWTSQLDERWRFRFWSGKSEIQILSQTNWTKCCKRLATVATFLQKKLCYPGAMTRRWTPQTRYTLRRNTASIMKDLIVSWINKGNAGTPTLLSVSANFTLTLWYIAKPVTQG